MSEHEELIRSTLVHNLMHVYPDGPPADEKQVRTWLQEILQQTDYSNSKDDQGSKNICADEHSNQIEWALTKAIEAWKVLSKEEKLPSTKKQQKQSFSLFAQLDAASWGAPRIMMEDLQMVSCPKDRIAMLQKVAHVDDVALDWVDVSPLLQEGLRTLEFIEDYIRLHRKWFDQGRASIEHWPIRCDLCQNILQAIVSLIVNRWETESTLPAAANDAGDTASHFSPVHDALFHLWSLWNDMWFDLMQNPVGQNVSTGPLVNMGKQVLHLLKNIETKAESESSSLLHPCHFLALVDPLARWFTAWVAHLTAPQLFHLLHSVNLLPDIWQRLELETTEIRFSQCKSLLTVLDAALQQHSLSLLKTILSCMRVKWFPASLIWEIDGVSLKSGTLLSIDELKAAQESSPILQPDNGDQNDLSFDLLCSSTSISNEQLLQVFWLIFECGKKVMGDPDTRELGAVCAEAIEILLLGAQTTEMDSLQTMLTICQDYIAKSNSLSVPECFDELLSVTVHGFKGLPSAKTNRT